MFLRTLQLALALFSRDRVIVFGKDIQVMVAESGLSGGRSVRPVALRPYPARADGRPVALRPTLSGGLPFSMKRN